MPDLQGEAAAIVLRLRRRVGAGDLEPFRTAMALPSAGSPADARRSLAHSSSSSGARAECSALSQERQLHLQATLISRVGGSGRCGV